MRDDAAKGCSVGLLLTALATIAVYLIVRACVA